LPKGAIPGRDLDTAKAALVQAQAAYDAAAKHLESVRSVSREAALKAAQGQLTSAEGKYKGAEAQVSYSEIRSPIDGVVTDRPLFAGETAAAGRRHHGDGYLALLAKTHIAQSLAQQMKVGDEPRSACPGVAARCRRRFRSSVPRSTPAAPRSKSGSRSTTRRKAQGGHAGQGRRSRAGPLPRRWKVPAGSILTAQDGSKSVMVVGADGAAHRKPVTLGIADADDVQVLSGLAPRRPGDHRRRTAWMRHKGEGRRRRTTRRARAARAE
jgi:HlyD family secretion protein